VLPVQQQQCSPCNSNSAQQQCSPWAVGLTSKRLDRLVAGSKSET
jgi:hypothetical protein